MDILEEMAKNGGEKSGSLSKNRSDFQLHFAMCLYFAEYLRDENTDFQILLDYDDDISLVRDNRVSFYQVKTSSIEKVLSEHILSGKNSDYITNLYKHVHKLGLKGIQGLFLISNLKIQHKKQLLEELPLESFSTNAKEKIVDLIKNQYGITNVQKGFFALAKICQTELPVNGYVSYVKGALTEVIERGGSGTPSYDPKSIYTCIKAKFDKQNNFENFHKITNKKSLLDYKGIDAGFLKDLIKCAWSHTYNDSEKKYRELLGKEQITIREYRKFITEFTQVKKRILSRDRDTLSSCSKIQNFTKNYDVHLNLQKLDNIYQRIRTLKGKDRYYSYALIFLAIEAYQNGEDL